MPNLRVNTIKSQDGTKGPTFDGDLEFFGESHIVLPKGTTAQRPTGVAAGFIRFNTDTKLVEQYNGVGWVTLNSYGVGRGVFGGGYDNPSLVLTNIIDYITIATTGNATDFGDLTLPRRSLGACSSSTRGVWGGGGNADAGGEQNIIDYVTIATTGNATDFGDLTSPTRNQLSGGSSSIRGVFGGGWDSPVKVNTIDYITIATTGNSTDFGDLTGLVEANAICSSSTRGVFGGGGDVTLNPAGVVFNIIEYITIATTGNATDFGDLTQARISLAACSSSTRGVFGGGYSSIRVNTIDYITIATTGNASDFGDLTVPREYLAACSSSTRGVFGGGHTYTPTYTAYNIIDYITIATIGNSQDFGDFSTVKDGRSAACSDSHGGLS
jgi:hypothetical protein